MKISHGFRLHPEGHEIVTIKEVLEDTSVNTKKGKCPRVNVIFALEDGTTISQKVLAYVATSNLMTQIFIASLKQIPEEPDTDDLIGKKCIIEIKHQKSEDTGNIFANVVACHDADEFEIDDEIA